MRAGFLTGVRAVEIRKIPDARSEHSDEAIIRVAHVGLYGTDLELYHGTSSYLKNKKTTYPHLFGHEWIGTIEIPLEISQGKHLKPGAIVTENTMIACLPAIPVVPATRTCVNGFGKWASTVIPALQQSYSQYQHILS